MPGHKIDYYFSIVLKINMRNFSWFQNMSKYLFKDRDTDKIKSQVMELFKLMFTLLHIYQTVHVISYGILMHTEISAACSKKIIRFLEDKGKAVI